MGAPRPLADRFWSKVSKSGPNECWVWTPTAGARTYGMIRHNQRVVKAHRVAWELQRGEIPTGLLVLHRCDNPCCVNPQHLFLGSQSDNMQDMAQKGRCWEQQKTHCKRGHEYSGDNTYLHARNHRYCRACNRIAAAKYRTRLSLRGAQ